MANKQVIVVGGGISGLVSAFELSEHDDVDITVLEAAPECGGKMRGYFNTSTGRFEEHSIRALSSTYYSLFDVFGRAGILDHLEPVSEYMFYERASGKHVGVDRTSSIDAGTVRELVETFDLSVPDMIHLAQKILHHVNASDDEREEMAHQKAGDVIGVDDFSPATRQFIVNWFGILTGARMHSKAVDIMDSFLLMFMPMTESPQLPPGEHSKSYCFNRPTSHAVDALVELLASRGVRFEYNSRMTNLVPRGDQYEVQTDSGAMDDRLFDAVVLAVPHEVMWSIGLIDSGRPFSDEWSFGSQFPMDELPDALASFAGRSYNLCFDAPWNIVFQIQHNGSFWSDVEFPEGARYNLSATCSSPHNKGSLHGKSFMDCTPDEALHEILYQLGIDDEAERTEIVRGAVSDPVYLDFTTDWESSAAVETTEFGPKHADGNRWVNRAQIYVRSAEDPQVEPGTSLPGVFLAGEVVTVPGKWKIPTMEQAAVSGRQAAAAVLENLGIGHDIVIDVAELEGTTQARWASALLSGVTAITDRLPQR
ncbi:FAD-dependent oxidoreductase [Arthrobacter echini]|uniref:FAD-dependent oxidoreductase n=1 Tax=Arthrobacter echini TaxID=1529066 RepID=A0A4V3Z5L3_9MICC|nr:FAD-dependent oxidoreductase [Arthrobacter echini]THJ66839.1 FAD-dependent oxidoreductase [Arthrobacter echini]